MKCKRAKQKKAATQVDPLATIVAGDFALRKVGPHYLVVSAEGEAMGTTEAKIEEMLRQFFEREF